MQRRRHRVLGTVGGAGQGPEPGSPLASDSEDDELPRRPALGETASPRVVPESDPEEPDVCPDVRGLRKRRHTPVPGHHPDVAAPCPDPDVKGSKKPRFGPKTAPDPDVGRKMAIPNVQPQNRSLNPQKVANPDVEHLAGSNPPLDVERDTDVRGPPETALFHPNCHRAALEVSSNPDVEERDPNPDVGGAKNGCRMLVVDSDTDVEEVEVLPDVGRPKIRRTAPNVPKTPGVEMKTPNPDVGGPKNGCWTLVDSDTDVEMENSKSAVEGPQNGHQMLTVDSDTDVEENGANPDVGCSQTHRTTQNVPKPQNIEKETHNADVEGSQKGHQLLTVDSDTDVEENGANPDVGYPKPHQTTQNVPKNQLTEMETQSAAVEGSQKARQMLVVDSDTDVEEDTANPDVGCPESHRTAPRDPDVKTETPNGDVEVQRTLLVESDTDVEEDASDPDVGTSKTHRATQNVPRNPRVETESPNPGVEGPQNKRWTLVVDSDTDVEENEVNPAVGCPKIHRITRKDPDVEVKNPNPDVDDPPREHWNLEVDSDTDVEDDDLSRRVLRPKSHKTPQNTRKDPTVVLETPNPDVGGLSRGSVASNGDSDTDVEDLNALPDAGAPKPHGTTPEVTDTVAKMAAAPDVDPEGPTRTHDAPDVKVTSPFPDVGAPKAQCPALNVDSDTDVEDNGVIPDVGAVRVCQGVSGDPDVAATPPNPDVSSPARPGDGSDTDMEEVAPTPDVRSLRTRIRIQNRLHPDVGGPTTGTDTDVEKTDPKRQKSSPKGPRLSPKSHGATNVEGTVPKPHDSAPNPDVEAPRPDVGAQQRNGETPVRGKDPAVPPDVSASKSLRLAPNLGVTGDAGATSGRDTGAAVAESDTDAEGKWGGPGHRGPPPRPPGSLLKGLPPPPPQKTPTSSWSPPRASCHRWPKEEEEPPEVMRPQLRPRGSPGSTPPKVLFTGVVASPGMEVALKTLGGSMATSVFDCTHLVTDRVRRTVKFLCAVARGVPIVTPEWLHESARGGRILVPGPFLVRDGQQERHFGFSLAQALRRARRHPLLQGYEVHVTPNVRPEPEHMRDIVTCSGGTFLPTMPHTYGPRRLVISCEADAGRWAPALSARLPLASAELLLTGLLRQRLQLQPFLLTPPAAPPRSRGTPRNSPTASIAPPGVPPHPPGDTQESPGATGSPREVPARGRSRRPPRDPPGTRRRPALPNPPTRQ
ncbi:mediator of DNA damage checkpoint protein 1 isoform X7 [Calonectris borealis]|uniref:mediator of DNA damage checkpoint protein 1 isoform X7 n=1 Tax=Calonectris borealis TaxID=1323832 RepID=UPI003F4C9D8F